MSALQKQNKYSRLVTNTLLLGISSFSSKILSFLLTKLYTSVLSEAMWSEADAVVQTANLLIPLMTLGIAQAVIRFGLDKDIPSENVFTNGFVTILLGLAGILLLSPVFSLAPHLNGNIILLLIYMLTSSMRLLFCQFVRSQMLIKLYAVDGILATLYTVLFNVLFLVKWQMGVTGYLLATIATDLLSALGLFIIARLWRYIKFGGMDKTLFVQMLKYSLPLVPATISWWLANASDRFFIMYMVGGEANGLYVAASKPPGLVSAVSTFFTEAWQISAVTDGQDEDRGRFFSTVYGALMAVAFLIGGGLILFSKIIVRMLVSRTSYHAAWIYVPLLAISSVFTFLQSFMSSVFVVEKKSSLSLYSVLIGAATSIALNATLIPFIGVFGACIANLTSSVVIFLVRVFMARKFIKINYQPLKLIVNSALIMAEALIMMMQLSYWPIWCGAILLVLVALNGSALLKTVQQMLKKPRKKQESQTEPPAKTATTSEKWVWHKGQGNTKEPWE
ncbi:MAG: polysaccharide biosynthesis C-terminal domain-containing protein [Oscillospiraceae bacterium]